MNESRLMKSLVRRSVSREIMARQILAAAVLEGYRKKGVELEVRAEGPEKRRLALFCSQVTRPIIDTLMNDGELLGRLVAAGFNEVAFSDVTNRSWVWDVRKKPSG